MTLAAAVLLAAAASLDAGDWPMWRYDGQRASVTPEQLADTLHLQWTWRLPPLEPAWPDQPAMQFDAAYQPIVAGGQMFVGSSQTDRLTAYDCRTGVEKWHFAAAGPIRFAPLAWKDNVYFVSDDGYLYCLQAADGALRWKFRGGPRDRLLLGNRRLISTWPARGAPVIADGKIYFAAGIWPFMGIFIHALDAETGAVVWTNNGDGSIFIKQPHQAESFAGVAPQGTLAVVGDHLLIPGGRSAPACYNRHTGKLVHYVLADNSKKGGGAEVTSAGSVFFNGGGAFDVPTGKFLGAFDGPLAASETAIHRYKSGRLVSHDPRRMVVKEVSLIDRLGARLKKLQWETPEVGRTESPTVEVLIQADARLIAGGRDQVAMFRLPLPEEGSDAPVWTAAVDGAVAALLAAEERLYVVTDKGVFYCFGADAVKPGAKPSVAAAAPAEQAVEKADAAVAETAKSLIAAAQAQAGFVVVWGAGNPELVLQLIAQSDLHVIVLDADAGRAKRLRDVLTTRGLYGVRAAVHQVDPLACEISPYLANLLVCDDPAYLASAGTRGLERAFAVLRPYGGVAALRQDTSRESAPPVTAESIAAAKLAKAELTTTGDWALVTRAGALPGAADWTHENADAANTRVSQDTIVEAPLGMLWFGGASHEGILPRHGHGPQPQVIEGRLIIEGVDMLRAVDVYTGRVLWETSLPGIGAFYNNTAHQPGANGAGANYVSQADGIYVVYQGECLRLDPVTGKTINKFVMPKDAEGKAASWGFLTVAGRYLIGTAAPLVEGAPLKPPAPGEGDDDAPKPKIKLPKVENFSLTTSRRLAVMDRQTGALLWTADAEHGFRHNTICVGGDRLYAIDRLPGNEVARRKRRGDDEIPPARLTAFDLTTGKPVWNTKADVFGTYLSYSAEHDVLVESGRYTRDALTDEARGVRAYRAGDGAVLWTQPKYEGPAMILGDTLLKGTTACELLTGRPKQRRDPLTGELADWSWSRTYGCNTPAASQNLLTFRSGAAGYCDLKGDGGTGNFGGFRSSCTLNLIVAGGVLSAPDYTRTCTCSYQNQTSLALVPMADVEMWTYFGATSPKDPVQQLGINLGAPGDRRAGDLLWVEYPSVAGKSPAVPIEAKPAKLETFRQHASAVQGGEGPAWVAASGVKGLESLVLTLGDEDDPPRRYTVRLHFFEPDNVAPGKRVFDVALQGQTVLEGFDVAAAASGARRSIVKEFRGIEVEGKLKLALTPAASAPGSAPILSGIEVRAETASPLLESPAPAAKE